MTLDIQLNLAESGKGYLEWLEEYEYVKGMFYSKYCDNKSCTSNTMHTAYSCSIIFFAVPPLFLRSAIASYKCVNQDNNRKGNQPGEI